jgi:hypothetical protein
MVRPPRRAQYDPCGAPRAIRVRNDIFGNFLAANFVAAGDALEHSALESARDFPSSGTENG